MSRRLTTAAIAAAVLATAGRAHAYPYFRTTSGTDTCGACHVSPTGGGPLTEWGRDETGDTLARGGDGAFLHGLVELPGWLDLGGDLRLAALVNDVGNAGGAELAAFPMQAELNARVERGAWHALVNAGVLGAIRTEPVMVASPTDEPAAPWLVSSAHYVMWTQGERGAYVRAGKFATPYGLRLADHTAYVRRRLGLGLYDEPYAISGGHVGDAWDVHVTAFVSDPWRGPADRDVGGAVLTERRAGPWVAALSAQVVDGADDRRAHVGAATSWWHEATSLYLFGELDGGWQWLDGGGRAQLTGYAGVAWLPARGVVAGGACELDDPELGSSGDTRRAVGLWSTYMPLAHLELALSGRYQWIGPGGRAATALLQLHYFL